MDRTCTCQLGGGCTTSPAFSRVRRRCLTSDIIQVVHNGLAVGVWVKTGLVVDLSLTENGQYQWLNMWQSHGRGVVYLVVCWKVLPTLTSHRLVGDHTVWEAMMGLRTSWRSLMSGQHRKNCIFVSSGPEQHTCAAWHFLDRLDSICLHSGPEMHSQWHWTFPNSSRWWHHFRLPTQIMQFWDMSRTCLEQFTWCGSWEQARSDLWMICLGQQWCE
jgi:hypothetical protein